MSKPNSASIVGAIENPDINKMMLESLNECIREGAERARPMEMIEIPTLGSPMVKMTGRGLSFDETKPRMNVGWRYRNTVDNFVQSSRPIPTILNDFTRMAGHEIGRSINGNCASCSFIDAKVDAYFDAAADSTSIMVSVNCKLGGGSVRCPDKIWEHDEGMVCSDIRSEYMTDPFRYSVEHQFLGTRQMGVIQTNPFVKAKEVVTDKDVEVEILKLDENYGMF